MKLVVGLGNLEERYDHTRHNVGFHWLDELANLHGLRFSDNKKFFGLTCKLSRSRGDIWLLKPGVYMNNSGRSVGAIASFFNFSPSEILIVHDELDLPPGVVRIKRGGGSAGHNGLKDIIRQLGSRDFLRIRLGIGRPDGNKNAVANYVLKKPSSEDAKLINESIEASLEVFPSLMLGDIENAKLELH